jgi:hypothetical protein
MGQSVRLTDFRIVSLTRAVPLTNAETVTLGRVLVESSETAQISFPDMDSTPTAMAVVHDYSGDLSAVARRRLQDILGEFYETLAE